jgi:hypothetical protein
MAVSRAFAEVDDSTPANLVVRDFTGKTTNLIAITSYNYAPAENDLVVRLGRDLATGAEAGDSLWVRTNGWARFDFQGDGEWQKTAQGNIEPADMHIEAAMGLWFGRGDVNDSSAFQAYATVSNPVDVVVYGTLSAMSGWNLYTWPHTFNKGVNNDIGFSSAQTGDYIYMYDSNDRRTKRLDYRNGVGWREGSRSASTAQMTPGQMFWYYSSRGGDVAWGVQGVIP